MRLQAIVHRSIQNKKKPGKKKKHGKHGKHKHRKTGKGKHGDKKTQHKKRSGPSPRGSGIGLRRFKSAVQEVENEERFVHRASFSAAASPHAKKRRVSTLLRGGTLGSMSGGSLRRVMDAVRKDEEEAFHTLEHDMEVQHQHEIEALRMRKARQSSRHRRTQHHRGGGGGKGGLASASGPKAPSTPRGRHRNSIKDSQAAARKLAKQRSLKRQLSSVEEDDDGFVEI